MVRISLLALWMVGSALGHEMPFDVAVRMKLRVEAGKLMVAARVPLEAMRDVEFPDAGGGYLDVAKLTPQLGEIATQWVSNSIQLRAGERELGRPRVVATRLALESDRSFDEWRGEGTRDLGKVVWNQLWLDVLMEGGVGGDLERLALRPGMEILGMKVVTVIEFKERIYELHGDPGWVELDPSWWGAARRFVALGFWHILDGMDHLLFLVCLVIPVRSFWKLVGAVSAFTVGHTITLISAALGAGPQASWFPSAVEVLIAASIVWMAIENITEIGGRWWVVAGFGLVHGFGFSFALKESLQLAGSHLLSSLVAFNVGVELGQVLVVGTLWALLRVVVLNRVWVIVLSALVAHTGWHWMLERWDVLKKYWP